MIEKLREIIDHSDNIVFFGGAGVSTESGIPDFRSKDGLYNQHDVNFEKYSPEYLLSHDCLVHDSDVFFEFYRQKMDTESVSPNAAHYYLAKLEKQGKLKAVVTQNIDGLHQKAGSKNVYEIHGTTFSNHCCKCNKHYDSRAIFSSVGIPKCSCGGIIRPDVVLYGESLPEEAVEQSIRAIMSAEVLIIGGTSLTVYPASGFVNYFRGKHLIVINKEVLPGFGNALQINKPIGEVFSLL